jgi:iron complex transport system permease protein
MLAVWTACLTGWAVVAAVCVGIGSVSVGPFWELSAGQFRARVELVAFASVVGAALAAAGVVYQAILANPLADPYLLGVSSGASLATYLWRFDAMAAWSAVAVAAGQQSFAVAGAVISVAIVFTLSTRRGRLEPVTLLLVGVIVNAINGSVFLLVDAIHPDRAMASGGAMTFLVGRLQTSLTATQEWTAAGTIAAGWLVVAAAAGALNVAALDESEAAALGLRVHRLRWLMLGTASVMTAAAVAVGGPIGFVGLVCPHLARSMTGTDVRRLLPVATAIGASLLAGADAASRGLSNPASLGTAIPVGVITGLIGGPFFLLLLYQSRHGPFGMRG